MAFTDFSKVETLKQLDSNLSANSYVEGFTPSQADVETFKAFGAALPNFAKWLKQTSKLVPEFETLPGGAIQEEDDEDVDLFGSDDEEADAEAERVKAERIAQYNAKKASKPPKPAAKSIVTMDVKPWDDETDMDQLTANVTAIEMDGLNWGAHKLIPIGFGIKKLQINCVVEDDKVSLDELQQQIEEDEDHVQSTDIAAMQKL
ncbi:elongation factor 1-beta/delta KNAG_0D03420 [Huiozyma naganishii CBS 8797]|uniref:Translation elongation factor EF1B beta/delta subunit guanine nucleotide exchange domain-containing protein n=1 Tax=Huiozyma naganishii (strain ATCC MYA-139 / BCRC 22969 / CBS 8797 / KCTC 17520 / NBRC 10181 / NCYC 3082 / Yp74L-3) TaxID=1071383 RepID=J7S5Y9_HUIN7|nr:hypothetical protein KNAG_0D03420 [Kazachstania naganishii CBS 8797]CCK70089.1 hypothetical protein KNAG_0D03420 [Kazachstania naganishii CBS 8797]